MLILSIKSADNDILESCTKCLLWCTKLDNIVYIRFLVKMEKDVFFSCNKYEIAYGDFRKVCNLAKIGLGRLEIILGISKSVSAAPRPIWKYLG